MPPSKPSATATIALGVTVLSSLGAVLVYDQSLEPIQVVGMAVVLFAAGSLYAVTRIEAVVRARTGQGEVS